MSIQSRVSGLCVITLLAAAPLTGCAPLAVGAIGATAFGVADRRSVGTQAEDQRIQLLGTQRVKEVLDILHAERDKKKRGEKSELMDLLIAYNWNDNFKLAPQQREVFGEHH